ncbi:anhydro-N-acetylmuramic acid kinase [Winogradskyella sediminis]|uniref:anhydro-N-acetylmuramic acid kinase n=1 Tax=Winogradskyella sediminis TaxID=1382466 RepID=UPI000E26017C|nr:anhydro-N-acetylmuramic acid kinase [Winogradskyella sediminis]REG85145.1 anhydro-N-acetylmuramic acid kinase [Winogradskyella sediminis]
MTKSTYNIIGVMSGTSLDGIDIIYASFDVGRTWGFKIYQAETVSYSNSWKFLLSALVNYSRSQLQAIDLEYSQYLGTVISSFIKRHNIDNIDFICSHGHTALHQSDLGLTYQIGNKQILADTLQQKVICDFRIQDVRLGGQGAPLVPIGDQLLFKDYNYCLNLGGFANISYEVNKERIAFDVCPVNIVLNYYVGNLNLEYDDKGQLAATGKVNKNLLSELNALAYFKEEAPKSLGLEWVDVNVFPLIDEYNLQVKDVLRTYIEHIAMQVSEVLVTPNAKLLITGGGVYNSFLMERIKHFSEVEVIIPNNEIVEFKEALIFGLLGVLKDRNEVNCLKSVTGAKKNHSSGKILMPKK